MPRSPKKPATNKKVGKSAKTEFKGYESFRLQKRLKPEVETNVPGSFRLFGQALLFLKRNFKLFGGMAIVYGLLYLAFVQGLTALNGLDQTKQTLEGTVTGSLAGVATGAALFAELLGNAATLSATATTYQFLITIIASLALIWTIRKVHAGAKVRIRDGFYWGMYPLIPFLLVLFVIALQLLPFAIGGTIFTTVIENKVAVTGVEIALWATGFFILMLVSLYLITSSFFALYVVSLPDVAPMQALRSARQLVRGRRWLVLRRMLFLPFALLIIGAVVMIPVLILVTPIAGWVFFLFIITALAVAHSYLYKLYRTLI